MDVTVVVATYGEKQWSRLAWQRAMPSALAQAPAIHAHADTLAVARNRGLRSVESEWVVHLDADDELEPGYIDALGEGTADLRAPAVRYVSATSWSQAVMPRVVGHKHVDCQGACLVDGNWLVIGTAVRTAMARKVGGWREWPLYEDWDLFLRCYLAGATAEAIPQAVYRAHTRAGSRNEPPLRVRRKVYQDILAANR